MKFRRGFTLIELLITVVILGIAGAMIIPSMGETGVLKVQAAVRTVVADITFAQSDAAAFQERRALVFDVEHSKYALIQVPGDQLDASTNTLYDPTKPGGKWEVDFTQNQFGDARIVSAEFDGNEYLIFDAMGGPVADATGATVGTGGTIKIQGSGQTFDINVEAFTGRVTVTRANPTP